VKWKGKIQLSKVSFKLSFLKEGLNTFIPEDVTIQHYRAEGKIEIDQKAVQKKKFLFFESILPPPKQPNYSRTNLLERMYI
jgi:hypothetical protein